MNGLVMLTVLPVLGLTACGADWAEIAAAAWTAVMAGVLLMRGGVDARSRTGSGVGSVTGSVAGSVAGLGSRRGNAGLALTPGKAAVMAALLAAPALPGALQLLVTRLGWATLTEDLPSTEAEIVRWLAAGLFLLAAAELGVRRWTRLLDLLAMLGGVVAVGSMASTWAWGLTYPFVNRNHLAAWCVMLLPVAVWRCYGGRADGSRSEGSRVEDGQDGRHDDRRAWGNRPTAGTTARLTQAALGVLRWWRHAAVASLLVGAMTAGSRAGFVLVIAESLLLVGILERRIWQGMTRWRVAAAGFVLVTALFGFSRAGGTLDRWRHAPWLLYRDQIWAASWELARERPVLGYGLGSFAVVYPAKAHFDTGERVHRAHSDWLEWAVEGGMLAPLPMAALGVWVTRRVRRRPWLLGVPLVLVHSLVDYPLDRFLLLLLLAVLVATALGERGSGAIPRPRVYARKRLANGPVPELESFPEGALQ